MAAGGTELPQPHRRTEAIRLLSIRSHCRHARARLCWETLPRRAPPRLPPVPRKQNCNPLEQLPLHQVKPNLRRGNPAQPEPQLLHSGRTEKATPLSVAFTNSGNKCGLRLGTPCQPVACSLDRHSSGYCCQMNQSDAGNLNSPLSAGSGPILLA